MVVGSLAFASNVFVMMFGRDGLLPPPVAGATGVIATLLLAICLFGMREEE